MKLQLNIHIKVHIHIHIHFSAKVPGMNLHTIDHLRQEFINWGKTSTIWRRRPSIAEILFDTQEIFWRHTSKTGKYIARNMGRDYTQYVSTYGTTEQDWKVKNVCFHPFSFDFGKQQQSVYSIRSLGWFHSPQVLFCLKAKNLHLYMSPCAITCP